MRFSRSSKIGIGCDIVSISRIRQILLDYPDRFRDYAFSSHEQQYCEQQATPYQHYAARWAVKEAYIKAVGMSEPNPDLTSIEVVSESPPQLSLSDDGLDLLTQKLPDKVSLENITISISISNEEKSDIALGLVIIIF